MNGVARRMVALVVALAIPVAPALAETSNGGVAAGKPAPSAAAGPVLAAFSVTPVVLTPGAAPSVNFLVTGRAKAARLRLVLTWPGTTNAARRIVLGRFRLGRRQTIAVRELADPALPEGTISVRIAGRDDRGALMRPAAHLSRVAQIQLRGHVFPLVGEFSYGDAGDRFGAARNGHTHQGQDLLAAEGTPVLAVRSGTISYVGYQASAAGNYIVLDADGEDYDYAYMHLQDGSTAVAVGQHVVAGQHIANVGHTGDATVSHLHFEVWQGAWWAGGHAIDPLPFLQQWQAWSPVTAT